MASVVLIPSIMPVSPEAVERVDDNAMSFTPSMGRGLTQRISFGDPRWRITRQYQGMRDHESVRISAALSAARGRMATVRATPAITRRGSFDITEFVAHPDFDNGVGAWTGVSNSLSVSDRIMRLFATGASDVSSNAYLSLTGLTVYAPYLARVAFLEGRTTGVNAVTLNSGARGAPGSSATGGLVDAVVTTINANATLYMGAQFSIKGEYQDISYASVSRCALVDNGANMALYSDDYTNAAWGLGNVTVQQNAVSDPQGNAVFSKIITTSANAEHYLVQTGTRKLYGDEDLCGYCTVVRVTSGMNMRIHVDDNIGNGGYAIFDLGAGTSGTVTNYGTGTNTRAFVRALGSGYFACYVITTVPASTLWRLLIYLYSGSSGSYAGSSNAIGINRAGISQSGVPTIGGLTTSSVLSTGVPQSGSSIVQIKGLPASTNGLLRADDYVEINGELKRCTERLDSDEVGLGALHVRPAMFSAADNAPVVILNPMGKFLLSNAKESFKFGAYRDFDLVLDEVYE